MLIITSKTNSKHVPVSVESVLVCGGVGDTSRVELTIVIEAKCVTCCYVYKMITTGTNIPLFLLLEKERTVAVVKEIK